MVVKVAIFTANYCLNHFFPLIIWLRLSKHNRITLLQNGVVSLIDCTLMEEPEGTEEECKLVTDIKCFILSID